MNKQTKVNALKSIICEQYLIKFAGQIPPVHFRKKPIAFCWTDLNVARVEAGASPRIDVREHRIPIRAAQSAGAHASVLLEHQGEPTRGGGGIL